MIVVNASDPKIRVHVVTALCSLWETECFDAGTVFAILRLSQRN
jgi:hypothetical protein